jgi:hypothetical protein
MDHEWLDQPNLLDGSEDRSVPANVLLRIFHLSHRKNDG